MQLQDAAIGHWFTVLGLVFGGLGIFVKEDKCNLEAKAK
jgi:hypothetical protein